jgi:hypothetical protein
VDVPRKITQIPIPGGSGLIPTGAIQFQDDWPGLFLRGDDALSLVRSIHYLQKTFSDHPDVNVTNAIYLLSKVAKMIDEDVKGP